MEEKKGSATHMALMKPPRKAAPMVSSRNIGDVSQLSVPTRRIDGISTGSMWEQKHRSMEKGNVRSPSHHSSLGREISGMIQFES